MMLEKGALSWKAFYEKERVVKEKLIDERIKFLTNIDDTEVLDVVKKGGVLSFPHTKLSGSLDPIIRTVKAVMDSGKENVVALAVVHHGNHDSSDEFSLDTFTHVLDKMKDLLDVEYPSLERIYYTNDQIPGYPTPYPERIEKAVEQGSFLRDRLDGTSAVVMTGDLCHCGEYYKFTPDIDDLKSYVDSRIGECMDLLYKKGDLKAFMESARNLGNDQLIIGMVARSYLGENNMNYRFFQEDLTDYTEVLGMDTPHRVASYFYGAWKN